VAGTCECGNEPPGSINAMNFWASRGTVGFQEGISCMELV